MGPDGEDLARLRAQIAETRNEMSETIEELHGRLNPKVLKEQALEEFHDASEKVKAELKLRLQETKAALNEEVAHAKAAVRDATIGKVKNMMHDAQERARVAGRSAREVVADNPIPAALAGLGLAWLFVASRRKRRSAREDFSPAISLPPANEEGRDVSTGERVRVAAQQAGQKVSESTREAASAVKRTGRKVAEVVGDVAHRTQESASELSHKAESQARRIGRRSREVYRENPIAIAAGLLAVGTLAGMAIPRTRTEDRLIGGARDDAMDKAEELAHKAFQKAGEAVQRFGSEEPADTRPEMRPDPTRPV